jgi:hypothetical protein
MAESQPKDGKSQSLRVYAKLRKTLIDYLNQFPNLEVVTVTNEVLNNNHDRYIKGSWWSPELDPPYSALISRGIEGLQWLLQGDIQGDGLTYGYDLY